MSNKGWVNTISPCTSTTGVPSLHLIACFHKTYKNLLLQCLCAFWVTSLQLTSRFRASRTGQKPGSQKHNMITWVTFRSHINRSKTVDMAGGAGRSGEVLAQSTQNSVTRDTWAGSALLSRDCSVHGKAPDLPTSVQFLYKNKPGPCKAVQHLCWHFSPQERSSPLALCQPPLAMSENSAQPVLSSKAACPCKGCQQTDRRQQLEKRDLGSLHTISPFIIYPHLLNTAWL